MIEKKKRMDVWNILSLVILAVYGLFLIYPLVRLLVESVTKDGNFTMEYFLKFFSNSYYGETLLHSFLLSISATVVSLALGVPLAYFYNIYEIKGRNLIQVVIILCCMSAPFIGAYAWVQLRGNNGIITQLIARIIGHRPPSIYGFRGIVLVLALQLYPLVFMLVSGALKNVDSSLLEAAQNMGVGGVRRFFKMIIPLCMPTILAAALLVFMRAFADYGTPLLIGRGYQTFPVIIYNEYFGETGTDHNFAAAVSVIAILITAVIFLVPEMGQQPVRLQHERAASHSAQAGQGREERPGSRLYLYHRLPGLHAPALRHVLLLPQDQRKDFRGRI